jgi:hypothetical protein
MMYTYWDYTVKRRYGTELGFIVGKASVGTEADGLAAVCVQ